MYPYRLQNMLHCHHLTYEVQSNPVDADTKGAIAYVHINGVSV